MKKLPGEKTRGGIVPKPGTKCGVCGRPASFECSCGGVMAAQTWCPSCRAGTCGTHGSARRRRLPPVRP